MTKFDENLDPSSLSEIEFEDKKIREKSGYFPDYPEIFSGTQFGKMVKVKSDQFNKISNFENIIWEIRKKIRKKSEKSGENPDFNFFRYPYSMKY